MTYCTKLLTTIVTIVHYSYSLQLHLHSTTLHHFTPITLHCAALQHTPVHHTPLHNMAFNNATLQYNYNYNSNCNYNCTTLRYTSLRQLQYTTLCYSALHCTTTLHYTRYTAKKNNCNYTAQITLHQAQLHYAMIITTASLHHAISSSCG